MPHPDLILSVLHNLAFSDVAPFLQSLRATGSQAKVHFFVCGVPESELHKIREYGASTTRFTYLSVRRRQPLELLWPVWREMFKCLPSIDAKCQLGRWVMHLFGVRWILYRQLLREHPNEFRRVLVSDCRDVFFQRDPFEEELPVGLHCFQEAANHTIGSCPYNSLEVLLPFGPDALAKMAQERVVCAGTTIGDQSSMLAYLDRMLELLCAAQQTKFDQGTHNYLVYHRLVPNISVHENGVSVVRTMGTEHLKAIPRGSKGEVLGTDGLPVPILHQYDRHPQIREELISRLKVRLAAEDH